MRRLVLLSSGARTSSGVSSVFTEADNVTQLVVSLNITAASGTSPTLNVVIEDSVDGSTWNAVSSFSQKVGIGKDVLRISTPFANIIRVSYTIGGTTPSFTFGVDATAK